MLYAQKSRNQESYIKFGAMAAILLQVNDTIHGTDALHSVIRGDLAGIYNGRKLQTKTPSTNPSRGRRNHHLFLPT